MVDALRIVVAPNFDATAGEALEKFLAEKLGPAIQHNARGTVAVRTGNLKDSIVVQVHLDGSDSVLQVGVDPAIHGVDYSTFVELGTSRQAAQPYLRPALLQAGGRIA